MHFLHTLFYFLQAGFYRKTNHFITNFLSTSLRFDMLNLISTPVVDIAKNRLDKALELGASVAINGLEENVIEKIRELTGGDGADLFIETAGTEITMRQCIQAIKKGGTIVLVGYSKTDEISVPVNMALDKELTFKTIFRYRHIYPMAIDAVASGKLNLKGIVTHYFDFDDLQNAMDQSIADKQNIVKSVIKI